MALSNDARDVLGFGGGCAAALAAIVLVLALLAAAVLFVARLPDAAYRALIVAAVAASVAGGLGVAAWRA